VAASLSPTLCAGEMIGAFELFDRETFSAGAIRAGRESAAYRAFGFRCGCGTSKGWVEGCCSAKPAEHTLLFNKNFFTKS
jgi:hypothetical protein